VIQNKEMENILSKINSYIWFDHLGSLNGWYIQVVW
jgi:hypothetical protein